MIKLIWRYVNCPIISVTLVTIRFKTRIQCHDQMKNSCFQLLSALLQAINSAFFQLCTVLRNVKGQRKSLSTPGLIFFPLLTHSFHWETGFDCWSPDFQLAALTHRVLHEPPGSCQCSSRCRACPRCVQPAGHPRWHWPGTANTHKTANCTPGRGWAGAQLCIYPSAANTTCGVPLEHVNA